MREDTAGGRSTRYWFLTSLFVLSAFAFHPLPALAANYGEVTVVIEDEPDGSASHGYTEIWFRIRNVSETAGHQVTLTLPKDSEYGFGEIRSITRTVTVEPGKTIRIPLSYPQNPSVEGSEIGVTIDGRAQTEALPVRSLGYSYSSRSRSGTGVLVLVSPSTPEQFKTWASVTEQQLEHGFAAGLGHEAGISSRVGSQALLLAQGSLVTRSTEYARAKLPTASWSPNWLGYSRYDGVLLTADELHGMPADVRSAIGQYVDAGGTVVVLGKAPPAGGPWDPARIKPVLMKDLETGPGKKPAPIPDFLGTASGFGYCFVLPVKDLENIRPEALAVFDTCWRRTAEPLLRIRPAADANKAFPIIETVNVPVRGFLLLMFAFAIVIGPVDLILLNRMKRKLWLFWTVPRFSFATCAAVLGFMVLDEGWTGKTRTETFTVLDENTRQATTLGLFAAYAPLTPRGGLHFSPQTEVNYQNGVDTGYGYGRSHRSRRSTQRSSLTMDWTNDQHLASGWLTPRVPSHFVIRKCEPRRERVTITPGPDMRPQAMNGLGTDVQEFWYVNDKGDFFSGGKIPAGATVSLSLVVPATGKVDQKPLRSLYTSDWLNFVDLMKTSGRGYMGPRTYVAILDACPFLDDPATKSGSQDARSAVYGILRDAEGGD